ncbi:4-hydroxy-tetrahydrodipicolinate reductase [Gemmatimonadetes bacterium T265]|nr:4-hydroxy-tetrahydrodipicolinate reductase [Gemmatimonadetes bacterium T265]
MSATPRVRAALIGHGKMGRAIEALAAEHGVDVVAVLGRGDAIDRATLADADVAIEFTEPDAAIANLRTCGAVGCPVVVGTTGWGGPDDELRAELLAAGARALTAANFSLGVNAILGAVGRLASALETAGFAPHVLETHHAAKKDAPSGTALALAAAAAVDGVAPAITSVRVGSVPGTHTLLFDAAFEQVRLTHEARDRRVFASGALIAARWLAAPRAPGFYTLQDVLAPEPSEESR